MLSPEARNQILYGLPKDVSDDIRDALTAGIDDISSYFEQLKDNKVSSNILARRRKIIH